MEKPVNIFKTRKNPETPGTSFRVPCGSNPRSPGRNVSTAIFLLILLLLAPGRPAVAEAATGKTWRMPPTPLPMDQLYRALNRARGGEGAKPGTADNTGVWPRTITFSSREFDYRNGKFRTHSQTLTLKRQPRRIIPHAVGISEVLWAISPRDRLVLFNQVAADPKFSIIADEILATGRIFNSRQTELVIAARPDIIFTVTFSDAAFKERLRRAGIRVVDFGAPDSLDAVLQEIDILGRIIGEEGNAKALLATIRRKREELEAALPHRTHPLELLFYDHGGYIPGQSSNFNSLCRLVGAVNLGAAKGIKAWKQVDNETLLKWNPEIILVSVESGLKEKLIADPLLLHTRAVLNHRILEIPGIYLQANSQYLLLSANLLAGIIYRENFRK